jgi:hypothetical protein
LYKNDIFITIKTSRKTTQNRKGIPRLKIFLNNSYIILIIVCQFTTLSYFACTGEHLVKIVDEGRTDIERTVAIFRKPPKRASCSLKGQQLDYIFETR